MDNIRFEEILQFIRTFYPNENPVPLHELRFLGKEKEYLTQCIDTTYVSYVGQFVTDCEEHIKKLTSAHYVVAIANGTAALHMALLAAGINPGDEVITQALTFVSTAAGIKHALAEPVFIDVEAETLGMSPEALRAFLKENSTYKNATMINKKTGKRIAAVIPMHTFGHPVRLDEISAICNEYGLMLIEDAA